MQSDSNWTGWLAGFAIGVLVGFVVFQAAWEESPEAMAASAKPIRQVVVEGELRAVGAYQELSLNTTTVQELTVPDGSHLVWLQAAGNNIRYRLDDTDPTTAAGFVLAPGDHMLPPGLVNHMRFLAEAGTATLRAQPLGL